MLGRYSKEGQFRKVFGACRRTQGTRVPCEYANYKNPLGIFILPHDLLMEEDADDERGSLTTEAAFGSRQARARRSRGAAAGRRGERKARSQGISGAEGPGTHALRRLGKQGHRLGLLRAKDFPKAESRANPARLSVKPCRSL